MIESESKNKHLERLNHALQTENRFFQSHINELISYDKLNTDKYELLKQEIKEMKESDISQKKKTDKNIEFVTLEIEINKNIIDIIQMIDDVDEELEINFDRLAEALHDDNDADNDSSSKCNFFGCAGNGNTRKQFSSHTSEKYCPLKRDHDAKIFNSAKKELHKQVGCFFIKRVLS